MSDPAILEAKRFIADSRKWIIHCQREVVRTQACIAESCETIAQSRKMLEKVDWRLGRSIVTDALQR